MARRFNLQPWRHEQREAQRKTFITITAAIAVITALLLGAYCIMMDRYIESQQNGISRLEQKIKDCEKAEKQIAAIKKLNEGIEQQISTIYALQLQRSTTVEILDHIAKKTPENILINNISYGNDSGRGRKADIAAGEKVLLISGVAENELAVSSFMSELNSFGQFAPAKIVGIERASNTDRYTVPDDTDVRSFRVSIVVSPKASDKLNPESMQEK